MMKFIKEQWKFFTIIGLLTIMFVIFMSVSFAGSFKRYKWTYEGQLDYGVENYEDNNSTNWYVNEMPTKPSYETIIGYDVSIRFDENQMKEKNQMKTEEEVENWFNQQGVTTGFSSSYYYDDCYQSYTITYEWSKNDMIFDDGNYYVTDMDAKITYGDLTLESGY